MSPSRLKKVAKGYSVVSGVTVQRDGLESSLGMNLGLFIELYKGESSGERAGEDQPGRAEQL